MASLSYYLDRASLYIALFAAWVAMLGSLYFSEVMGFVPCDLCWYQRILMYPLTLILLTGLLLRDKHLPKFVLPLSTLGMVVSSYHYLLEKTDWFDAVQICRNGASCTTLWINWLGFITIPFLALVAFTTITVMAVIALMAGEPAEADEDEDGVETQRTRAWLPAFGVVGVVLLVFGTLFSTGWQKTAESRALAAEMAVMPVSGPMTSASGALLNDTQSSGLTLYREACSGCHGLNAEGVPNLGNVLVNNTFIQSLSDVELLQFIRNGRDLNSPENTSGLVMPPSGGRPDLDDTQMNMIIAYLRAQQTQ
jgi:disulfide bond formation protein DsbB/mono/diheme cytochrome c family protein